jgi:hypothetical protein
MSGSNRVFISCASREFQSPGAPFDGLREHLARQLIGADCEVKWQEVFSQPGDDTDTLRKIAGYVRNCAAVIHLIGAQPGDRANPLAVADYLKSEPGFLNAYGGLRESLGDFSDLTYTQWEAFQALHYGVRLFPYVSRAGTSAQHVHLDRLRLARRFPPEPFETERDLYGLLLRDLRKIIPDLRQEPPASVHISPTRIVFRHPAEYFLGRTAELALLDQAWAHGTNALAIIAWGGVGKTALLIEWLQTRFIVRDWRDETGAPLLNAYFDWTFYDQGTDRGPTSNDIPPDLGTDAHSPPTRAGNLGAFFERALTFFGDPDPTLPAKGERLARLVQAHRTLFVLDGLEPLQHPPGSPQAGHLLDPDLTDLIHALALLNPGLLLITSREHLPDLAGESARHRQYNLEDLTRDAAVTLLRSIELDGKRIIGTDEELSEASERFECHALSLTLLGTFLIRFHDGDIRRMDGIRDIRAADAATRHLRHRTVWRVLQAYEDWLGGAPGQDASLELAVLRLTGLFDRPVTGDLLDVLRKRPMITGLTDALIGLDDLHWEATLLRLADARLVKIRPETNGVYGMDTHPLIREYFAKRLSTTFPKGWRKAHSRIFDYLCGIAPPCGRKKGGKGRSWLTSVKHGIGLVTSLAKGQPSWADHLDALVESRPEYATPTLEQLQPSYQAIIHGVAASREREAYHFFQTHVQCGRHYSFQMLGALNADLGALSAFFSVPWTSVSSRLSKAQQGWVLNHTASCLVGMNRIKEAHQAVRLSCGMAHDSKSEVIRKYNLIDLEILLGSLQEAEEHARELIALSTLGFEWRVKALAQAVNVFFLLGRAAGARQLFDELKKKHLGITSLVVIDPQSGFCYSTWVFAPLERSAWLRLIQCDDLKQQPSDSDLARARRGSHLGRSANRFLRTTREADETDLRGGPEFDQAPAQNAFQLSRHYEQEAASLRDCYSAPDATPFDRARTNLILARATLIRAVLSDCWAQLEIPAVPAAIDGLRRAGRLDTLPSALLTAAWYHALRGELEPSKAALDEAWIIAERGPMPLVQADVLLYRSRLWLATARRVTGGIVAGACQYAWPDSTPQADALRSRRIIESHRYWLRMPELHDLEEVLFTEVSGF